MQVEINSFTKKYSVLHKKGLSSPLGSNEHLMKHVDYTHKMNKYIIDQTIASTSVSRERELPSGQSLYDNLENLFYIEHEVNIWLPSHQTSSCTQRLMRL